jgi:hypothetical protein
MLLNASARDGLALGGGAAVPTGSVVEFAMLSP